MLLWAIDKWQKFVFVSVWEIDPCDTHNGGCHMHATCDSSSGDVECTCNEGFVGDGFLVCKGILNWLVHFMTTVTCTFLF